jgi:hypothetical protein
MRRAKVSQIVPQLKYVLGVGGGFVVSEQTERRGGHKQRARPQRSGEDDRLAVGDAQREFGVHRAHDPSTKLLLARKRLEGKAANGAN